MSRNSRYYTAPVPKMPPGLIELMDGLARDVLKNNPTDVYAFCSDHMKKLLEIRDGSKETTSKVKRSLTLEQKIALATKIINERAASRREEYDKNIQVLNVEIVENINRKSENGVITEAGQYIKDNVVKFAENDLSVNTEHEIVAANNKFNENTTPLPGTDKEIDSSVEVINVNDTENDLNKEVVITIGKADVDDNEDNVAGDVSLKNNFEDNVQISSIGIENNTETESLFISEDVDAPTTTAISEENNLKNESVNDETEKNESLESQNNQVVSLTFSPGGNEHHPDSNNQNECGETNVVEELNIKAGNDSNIGDRDLDKVTQNNQIEDEKNITAVDGKSEPLDSKQDVQDGSLKANEIIFFENNDNTNETMDSTNELSDTGPSSVNDDNAEEDKRNLKKLVSEVNNTSMDLETAAITIQKVFRSFLFRNKTLSVDEATNVDINLLIEDKEHKDDNDNISGNTNNDRRALGLSRIDTVLQTVNEEKSLSLSTDDSSLSSAATIIQAHVRGFLVRNKFNFNKVNSSTSGIDSDGHSTTSFEADNDGRKNKTVLNIHIVPEGGHFMSRDESMLTSIDLSVDGSPRDSGINLHPMGYDTSERRKLLKREDAIQSISPPSNNSGKQSEEVDSVKEILDQEAQSINEIERSNKILDSNAQDVLNKVESNNKIFAIDKNDAGNRATPVPELGSIKTTDSSLPSLTSDEMDVVTPFPVTDSECESRMIHSGEFHDVLLPTKVSRSNTSVVRGE